MREQSHLEDMRAAVRGDRERAAARRAAGESERSAAGPDLRAVPPAPPEPDPEPVPEPEVDQEPDQARRSFIARLFRHSPGD